MVMNVAVSRADMEPGSAEEQQLMQLDPNALPIPAGASVEASKWAYTDKTCQVMIWGEGQNGIVGIAPDSTGMPGDTETRNVTDRAVFRYDPASANGGWHDSTAFPTASDSKLNGNMYKPLYFDQGQAIHGANTVPTHPASHGCIRLTVADDDRLISWLGLADRTEATNKKSNIGLVLTVTGAYE